MSTADQITGIIPTVVAGGVAIKFTQSLLGKPKRATRKKRTSKKNSPW